MSSFSLAKRIQGRDLLLDRRPRAGADASIHTPVSSAMSNFSMVERKTVGISDD